MEESQMNDDQSADVSETDMMDCPNLDGDGEGNSPKKDSAKGERQPSADTDVDQSSMEIDLEGLSSVEHEKEKQFAMDVDLKGMPHLEGEGKEKQPVMDMNLTGIQSVQDEAKGKASSYLCPQDPVDFNVASLEKFCKEASRSFFSETGLVSHQINSYNDFVSHGLQELLNSIGEIAVEPDYNPKNKDGAWKHATIKFGKVKLEEPVFMTDNYDLEEQDLKLKPRHARLQKMTYSSRMIVEMTVQVYTLDNSDKAKTGKGGHVSRRDIRKETTEINIGMLPVMVKSNLCWLHKLQESDCQFDYGGYFLIKGMEKVFIAEEQRCLSRIWITEYPSFDAIYLSVIKRERIYVKLVQSKTNESRKVINISFLGVILPIWIVFFALGVSSDKEAVDMIDILDCDASIANIISSTVKESHEDCEGFRAPGRARQYVDGLIRKTKFPPEESFDEYVCKYMFPDVSGTRSKAIFLSYMVKSLLMAYSGNRKYDNKDDFRNKRLDLACQLLRRELWGHIKFVERRMVKLMQRDLSSDGDIQDLRRYVDASIVTNGLNRAFSTGSWRHPYKSERCSGVVATLRRANPLQMMSDLRKTRQWFAYSGTTGDARYPNPSYWGKLCFLSTPDGEKCGFVKNLAVTATISSMVKKPLIDTFVSCGMKKLDDKIPLQDISGKDRIFLNGSLLGVCADPGELISHLKSLRRSKLIDPQVEIKRDRHNKEVRVFSDPGRILRPLLVVENLRRITRPEDGLYSFQELMDKNIIELIGAEEEEDIRCAPGIRHLFAREKEERPSDYTHCELDPSFLLGLSCSLIPFANHANAKRVLMQAEKISQQAIGYSPTNSSFRFDTLSHQMFYPQRPLFKTVVADCLGKADYRFGRKDDFTIPEYFNGQNAIVSVSAHQGFNQEDSLVMNRASLERGMFRTLHFKSYRAQIENKEITRRLKHREKINFGKVESKKGKVDSLDNEGLPYVGASLQSGDIVIGKVTESGEDLSAKLMHTEQGMVEKVVLSANDDGVNFATVTLRQCRSPCVGDKFASMHGQKGVVGLLDSQENFPFTRQGIVPDIVINPHGFPTRQTPGQLLEAALGKGIALGGMVRYATPFTTPSVDVITEQLHKFGFSRWGGESVLNGQTGERMKSLIFIGPTFYQRLTHMSEDKVKFRNTGPVHPLTRQPVEDKKRFGGVKFGEMERDCLLGHGAAASLHERLFMLSDFSQMHICQVCERVANVIMRPDDSGKKIHGPYCLFCRSVERIIRINVPYGAKLLYQELFSMGICLKFETEAR
ncbi:hypothetical protein HU200_028807 [Digitaria exilis]|uniref:DNA-directed RNA polymerase subunit beta n=1 Tax=Digitaria exilis TaxID=1010633 RepID=A0A835BW61_9POAL|nr:hypothetical protein HU200_028807 [Digitaria exilis]